MQRKEVFCEFRGIPELESDDDAKTGSLLEPHQKAVHIAAAFILFHRGISGRVAMFRMLAATPI
jgi:hypothetical protein